MNKEEVVYEVWFVSEKTGEWKLFKCFDTVREASICADFLPETEVAVIEATTIRRMC